MFPGHSPDHPAPSGNPKAKAIGAGADRREHSLHQGSSEPPQPHRGIDRGPRTDLQIGPQEGPKINTQVTAHVDAKCDLTASP